MDYIVEGLESAPFEPWFALSDAELERRGARRMTVDAAPGFPCRVTLEEAQPGESVILLNHTSRAGEGPYRASHAIFVRERARERAVLRNAVPEVFATRVLSLRGFDARGMMVEARLSQPGEAEAGLQALFANREVVEIDAHNAVRGCFSARARRA